jgi:hypothetical protein
MISTWAIELFLDKLNTLEDSATNSSNAITQENIKTETEAVHKEFQNFIDRHKVSYSITMKLIFRKTWIVKQRMIL